MSSALSKVIGEVLQEALAKSLRVLDDAEKEAMRVIDRTEEDLMKELGEMQERGRAAREAAVQRILSTAEIQSKNMSINAVEEEVSKIFETVLRKIGEEASSQWFKAVMEKLLDEAVQLIGRDMVVESNKEGIKMLNEILAEKRYGVKVTVSDKPVELLAGLRAVSVDGAVRFDNSVEARLERMRAQLRTEIAKLLLQKD